MISGHMILPLLRAEVVPNGWVADEVFLAGYGAAQALPGPLFAFACYLGTTMSPGPGAWLGGLWCLLAIFLPSWLLALPFWHQFVIQTVDASRVEWRESRSRRSPARRDCGTR